MADDASEQETPTRREYVKYGGAVVGGGLVAGCAGDGGSGSTPTEPAAETDTAEVEPTEDTGYSVSMSPMGTVEFDAVPDRAVVYDDQIADYLVALGQQDRMVSLGFPDRYYTGYYDQLPGVEFEIDDLTALYTDELALDKEILYELEADVHHLDPVAWQDRGTFDEDDIEEIEENIGPFFANRYSRGHGYGGEKDYEYYTIWEMLDRYAQVYQVRERGEAMKQVRDGMLEKIYAKLPPQEERPDVGLVVYAHNEEAFWVYRLNGPGFGTAHTRPLRANDGLTMYDSGPETDWESGKIDMEAMLEADPDVLLHNFDWTNFRERTEAFLALEEHPVAREFTAVKNDRLYATGSPLQGPVWNIFQLEITAKQIYPDLFGEPPEPDTPVPADERLFDRQRVADIINGNL